VAGWRGICAGYQHVPESPHIRILGSVKADNILFEKRGVHYATVGARLENVLSAHFEKEVCVTVRSAGTLAKLMNALPDEYQ